MAMSPEEIHELLLANQPEDATHDSEECPLCRSESASEEETAVADEKYTLEQHNQLLSAAVDVAVAEAKSESDSETLKLNERIAELEASLAERDQKITEFEEADAARVEASRLEALAIDRVTQVREVASFTDEQIEARKDRWARMGDEDFAALIEDYSTIGTAKASNEEIKSEFDGTRATASDDGSTFDAMFKTVLAGGVANGL